MVTRTDNVSFVRQRYPSAHYYETKQGRREVAVRIYASIDLIPPDRNNFCPTLRTQASKNSSMVSPLY
jgi:hypothetical protein